MKGFRNLVVLGILLVTLLFVIDTINAGRKEPNIKEAENKKIYSKKLKLSENHKQEKGKKSNIYTNFEEDYKQFNEDPKFETKKYKVKKGTKYVTKDSKTVEEGMNPKITKTYKKVKKYQVVEDEPLQNTGSSRIDGKKGKSQVTKGESFQEVIKSLKKTSQKRSISDPEIDNIVNEELNKFYDEENIAGDEDNANSPKRKKYKLVEVVLEEDEEEMEPNETLIEVGNEISGTEEVIEKYKTTQTLQYNAEDNAELEYSKNSHPEDEGYTSRYDKPGSQQNNCKQLPEDPNRKGPKKLTLYVVEEEVNGQIRKRVIPEEDGVSMCEVADLLSENYYAGLI